MPTLSVLTTVTLCRGDSSCQHSADVSRCLAISVSSQLSLSPLSRRRICLKPRGTTINNSWGSKGSIGRAGVTGTGKSLLNLDGRMGTRRSNHGQLVTSSSPSSSSLGVCGWQKMTRVRNSVRFQFYKINCSFVFPVRIFTFVYQDHLSFMPLRYDTRNDVLLSWTGPTIQYNIGLMNGMN